MKKGEPGGRGEEETLNRRSQATSELPQPVDLRLLSGRSKPDPTAPVRTIVVRLAV
jgi:hypothetical protein